MTPFVHEPCDPAWLVPFVPGKRHEFRFILRQPQSASPGWHNRASRMTRYEEWIGFWQQSKKAWESTQGGLVTVFPQLAAMVGIHQRISRKRFPVVAWCFNVGACYPGIRQWLSKNALQSINRFVVHSRRERETCSQWLGLPIERFEFVPLQVGEIPVSEQEQTTQPFILAMGSANRDYPTLFEAVERLRLRTIVIAGQHALEGLTIPPQVEVRSGLTHDECRRLAQQARVNIVPLHNHETASGQVTIVEAMRMSRAVVATRCMGSEDYINDGETGLLVEPYSVDELAKAINVLWNDRELNHRLSKEAGRYSAEHFSDQAAGSALGRILNSVADEAGLN